MKHLTIRLITLSILAPAAAQECTPSWSDQFPVADLNSGMSAALFADDGHGPALYVAGSFEYANDVPVTGIARWDGHQWSALGVPPFTGGVDSMGWFDPDAGGPLAPRFYVAAKDVYSWDGAAWSTEYTLGGGISLYAMQAFDEDGPGPKHPALFAGYLRFDGNAWQPFAYASPSAMVVFDPDEDGPQPPALYYGGSFNVIGPDHLPAAGIARWTGTKFEEVGGGVQGGGVGMLKIVDLDGDGPNHPVLIASGNFESAGGIPTPSLAVWDGTQWSALGGALPFQVGINGVAALTLPGGQAPTLFAAATKYILRLDGQDWTTIATVKSPYNYPSSARDACLFDPDADGPEGAEIAFIGAFRTINGSGFYGLTRFDGQTFRHISPGNSPMGTVRAMLPFDEDGNGPGVPPLIVGGAFRSAAGIPADRIVRWNGHEWSALGSGLGGDEDDTFVGALAEFDEDGAGPKAPALFVGGDFDTAGGAPAANIARWNGTSWSALAGGVNDDVKCMAVYAPEGGEPSLYVGGRFDAADGQPAGFVARWDGAAWQTVPPLPDQVLTLYVHQGDGPAPPGLYAGTTYYAYRLDQDAWTRVGQCLCGGGIAYGAHKFITYDPDGPGGAPADLIVGGSFYLGSIQQWTNIARFDGTEWKSLGGGTGGLGIGSCVWSMAVHDDDGDGPDPPSLFAGGSFSYAGDVDTYHIARWDGLQWHAVGGGVAGNAVYSLVPFDEDRNGPALPVLYVGGDFEAVGGHSSSSIARWGCPLPPGCYSDCDGNFGLDLFDFLCFVNRFNAGNPAADCDGNGKLSLFDFLCFVNSFNAGC